VSGWPAATGTFRPMSSPRVTQPHPAAWLVLIVPFGAAGGFVSVGLTFLATRHGLSITQGALLGAASLAAQWLRWLWAPLVDITLTPRRWYLLSTLLCSATVLAMAVVDMTPQTLPLLLVLIAASSIATTVLAMAVEAVMTVSTPPEQFGRVSAWQNAGNLGGSGIGGGLGLYLLEHLPAPWMAGAIMAVILLACAAAWHWVGDVRLHPCGRTPGEAVARVARELWQTLRERGGMLAGLLLLMPVGTGAASGVLTQAAVAAHWGAGADAVALTQGVVSGIVTAAGCFAGGWLCHRMHPRTVYVVVGLVLGAIDLVMVVSPSTVTTYVAVSIVYAFFVGVVWSAYTAVVLDAIGVTAAATKFSVMASLANFPIWWMGLLLGWVSDRHGPAAMLETEAVLSVVGVSVFSIAAIYAGRWMGRLPKGDNARISVP
jgi:MFS transporter, PAT family, beta-lactamase induction signal transducer AmpG